MSELMQTENRIAELNAQIEHQRNLIVEQAFGGQNIISAQIIYDSLVISLSLHVQLRHRLRLAKGDISEHEDAKPAAA
jgi:hypothetical protein